MLAAAVIVIQTVILPTYTPKVVAPKVVAIMMPKPDSIAKMWTPVPQVVYMDELPHQPNSEYKFIRIGPKLWKRIKN